MAAEASDIMEGMITAAPSPPHILLNLIVLLLDNDVFAVDPAQYRGLPANVTAERGFTLAKLFGVVEAGYPDAEARWLSYRALKSTLLALRWFLSTRVPAPAALAMLLCAAALANPQTASAWARSASRALQLAVDVVWRTPRMLFEIMFTTRYVAEPFPLWVVQVSAAFWVGLLGSLVGDREVFGTDDADDDDTDSDVSEDNDNQASPGQQPATKATRDPEEERRRRRDRTGREPPRSLGGELSYWRPWARWAFRVLALASVVLGVVFYCQTVAAAASDECGWLATTVCGGRVEVGTFHNLGFDDGPLREASRTALGPPRYRFLGDGSKVRIIDPEP